MQPLDNKRHQERFPLEVPVMLEGGVGTSRNMSESGIFFVTDTPMVTDRLLLAPWLSEATEPIAGGSPNDLAELHRRLRVHGQAVVVLPPDAALLNRIMAFAATAPVQLEYLNVYPRLTAVERGQGRIALHFELEATA